MQSADDQVEGLAHIHYENEAALLYPGLHFQLVKVNLTFGGVLLELRCLVVTEEGHARTVGFAPGVQYDNPCEHQNHQHEGLRGNANTEKLIYKNVVAYKFSHVLS